MVWAEAHILILTTCSSRKKAAAQIRIQDFAPVPQPTLQRHWLAALEGARPAKQADELYVGNGVKAAVSAARAASAQLFVVSAGLGLIPGEREVPAYRVTLAEGHKDSLRPRVLGTFDAEGWWQAMKTGAFSVSLDDVLAKEPVLVLVALSRPYCKAALSDLRRIEERFPGRLRFFGLSIGQALPVDLRPYALPYDARFDRIGKRGTRNDFAQRALEHFTSQFDGDVRAPVAEHARWVESHLADVPPPRKERHRKVSDEEIRALIPEARRVAGKKRDAVLNHIRNVAKVSCEERRFRRICASMKEWS